jgi:hypothetical protein
MRYRVSFFEKQGAGSGSGSRSRSSTLGDKLGLSSEDGGALSAFGRLAMNSIRAAEIRGVDAFLSSSKDGDSVESSDSSSRDPDSPVHRGEEFGRPRSDSRDVLRDSRGRRRRGSFMRRLVHR